MRISIPAMLDQAVRSFPERGYLYKKTDAGYVGTSFKEAREKARAVAKALIARGFAKDESAAIIAEGDPAWVIFELGLTLAGLASVPLSIKLLPEEIPFRVNHSLSRAILVSRNTIEKVASVAAEFERKDILLVCFDVDEAWLDEFAKGKDMERKRVVGFEALLAEGASAAPSAEAELEARLAACSIDDTVTICYTSGTTGNPKGIMLSHKNYHANCEDAVEIFEVPLDFQTLVILPVDHSFAHTVAIYTALLRGVSLYFVDARGGGIATLRNIPINMKEANPDFLLTVPALTGNFMRKIQLGIQEKGGFIESLFEAGIRAGVRMRGNGYNKVPLGRKIASFPVWFLAKILIFGKVKKIFGDRIKFCVGGGALLDVKQQEFYLALGVPVWQGYGLTEAAPIISANTPKLHKLGTSGVVLPSVVCRILREDGSACEIGETGEIVIQGDNVMKGYFRNEEATTKAIRDGWLYTGDRGYLDQDGFLVVVGREKALLIAQDGEKYSPEEIEEAIVSCSGLISQVMLYCDHRKYTGALVVIDEDRLRRVVAKEGIKEPEALIGRIEKAMLAFRAEPGFAKRFPAQWQPSTFRILTEAFTEQNKMINSTMKMVRHKIAEAYADDIEYLYGEGSKAHNPRNLEAAKALLAKAGS
jgi:long-chain acyl-CoA synthetase